MARKTKRTVAHAVTPAGAGERAAVAKPPKKKRKYSILTIISALIILFGLTVLTYPYAAAWVNQYQFSQTTVDYSKALQYADPSAKIQLQRAYKYNRALKVGAIYEANTNIPTASGNTQGITDTIDGVDYWHQLSTPQSSVMARLKIKKIDLDLPVYHGTSDSTLLKGLGHLRGTSLPVGGKGTRSLITGHRGLAEAEMFTRLDEVKKGDRFVIEVYGKVMTYRVIEKIVVKPDEKKAFLAVPGRDLVTLVTCTPLGINTHRILVTGERIFPTPKADKDALGKAPDVPGFPWWAVLYAAGVLGIIIYLRWANTPPKKKSKKGKKEKKAKGQDAVAAAEVEGSH